MWVLFLLCCGVLLKKAEVYAYKAAVLEYFPDTYGKTPRAVILTNIDKYATQVSTALDKDSIDIIVFPEYGLTGMVEKPENYSIIIPEKNNKTYVDPFSQDVFTRLSHIASQHSIYVVVNLLEKTFDGTRQNRTIFYNTNLVFNRTGQLIAKYRKIHLYKEPNLTPGKDIVTFTTDFGITFGIFTCFDILYITPARKILNQANVTDIVYPHAWFSTMPFYVSTSLHHGYAQATGVNLLAANLNNPKVGNGGSGIYLSDGTIAESYISAREGNKLIVASIDNKFSRPNKTKCVGPTPGYTTMLQGMFPVEVVNISQFKTYKDFAVSEYAFTQISLMERSINKTICHNKFCCSFQINITNSGPRDYYQLVAFNGMSLLGQKKENVRFCALIACANSNKQSCGTRVYNTTTVFSSIKVTTSEKNSSNSYIQPSTLNSDLMPISNNYCRKPVASTKLSHELSTQSTIDHVLVFGFYGVTNGVRTLYQTTLLVFLSFMTFVHFICK